ncbi:MAG: PqqD family protein [Bacilli bacterium]|nr:PqqD family protein [Bacilli bacterium]
MKLKYNFVLQEVGKDYFAVVSGEDTKKFSDLIKLNSVGKDIFELLKDETTIEKVIEGIKEKYEGSDEEIESSVKEFVLDLKVKGLLND